tara:strand:+ start:225 stop:482 length:258 start_codon:yes stop_codon:yes gene_type:complete
MGSTKGNTMQKKPKTGDLFDRGRNHNFELVTLKAHRKYQYITILHDQIDAGGRGIAIDYNHLTSGGRGYNGDIKKRVKIWKIKGQ